MHDDNCWQNYCEHERPSRDSCSCAPKPAVEVQDAGRPRGEPTPCETPHWAKELKQQQATIATLREQVERMSEVIREGYRIAHGNPFREYANSAMSALAETGNGEEGDGQGRTSEVVDNRAAPVGPVVVTPPQPPAEGAGEDE